VGSFFQPRRSRADQNATFNSLRDYLRSFASFAALLFLKLIDRKVRERPSFT
jgi:hypothetical protein